MMPLDVKTIRELRRGFSSIRMFVIIQVICGMILILFTAWAYLIAGVETEAQSTFASLMGVIGFMIIFLAIVIGYYAEKIHEKLEDVGVLPVK